MDDGVIVGDSIIDDNDVTDVAEGSVMDNDSVIDVGDDDVTDVDCAMMLMTIVSLILLIASLMLLC